MLTLKIKGELALRFQLANLPVFAELITKGQFCSNVQVLSQGEDLEPITCSAQRKLERKGFVHKLLRRS